MASPHAALDLLPPAHGIDHVTIGVRDYAASRRFYELGLRPLGFGVRFSWPAGGLVCLGLAAEPSALRLREGVAERTRVSLAAEDRASVDAFYAAALAAGGTSSSAPAFRPEYTASTYAAEVLDPDGNSVEAICRRVAPAAAADAA
jgi:catechol 2,3-dioxygenase-like lactoylglutathione lyase family enzyme